MGTLNLPLPLSRSIIFLMREYIDILMYQSLYPYSNYLIFNIFIIDHRKFSIFIAQELGAGCGKFFCLLF